MNFAKKQERIEAVKEMQKMRDKGCTLQSISDRFGINITNVVKALKNGVSRSEKRLKDYRKDFETIKRCMDVGMSMAECCAKIGKHHSYVTRMLNAEGIAYTSRKPEKVIRKPHRSTEELIFRRAKMNASYNKCKCGNSKRVSDIECPICWNKEMYTFAGLTPPQYYPPRLEIE